VADAHEIVVQFELADGGFRCRAFSGVPAARRSWISIVSSGSGAGRKLAEELAAELETVLLGSTPQASGADFDCDLAPADIDPSDLSDRLKVLILVGSQDQKFVDRRWYENWDSDKDQSHMMLVLPPGRYEDQFDSGIGDEHLLRRVNASTWTQSIAETLPAILARAEITSSISRVFISYRRLETLSIALQLFDRMVHEGFDVFLDRFSIPPGYDFQRRLNQELEDKSMVVLLESKSLRDSKWTQHEIDFAKRHRLGMLAVRMPDVTDDIALRSITADAREPLKDADFTGPPTLVVDPVTAKTLNQWPELVPEATDRIVARIKKTHAHALFRRRHRLRVDVVAALNAESGVHTQYCAVGPLKVVCGSDEHVVWLTTRPPELDDFRSVHGAHLARTIPTSDSRGIVVGPQAALEPDRQDRLRWLRDMSRCPSFDEGNLADFARRLATRSWP
jgi:hypothetical protein